MSASWVPPRRAFHLQTFAASLALIIITLAGLLFLVSMEAVVPATGTVTAREVQEVRTVLPGLVEPATKVLPIAGERHRYVPIDAADYHEIRCQVEDGAYCYDIAEGEYSLDDYLARLEAVHVEAG